MQPITKRGFRACERKHIARRNTFRCPHRPFARASSARVITAILLGDAVFDLPQDDLSYSIDLGLIRRDEQVPNMGYQSWASSSVNGFAAGDRGGGR